MADHGFMAMRSPPCWLVWGPWRARTDRMQRCGWQFMVNAGHSMRDPLGMDVEVSFRDPQSGFSGLAYARKEDLMEAVRIDGASSRPRDWEPELQVRVLRDGGKVHLERAMGSVKWSPISMEPELAQLTRMRLSDIFAPFQSPAEEIIVEPRTVAGLMEEIRKLQEPELAAIRERNRRRDPTAHLQEQPVPEWRTEIPAQIITLRKVA